MQFIKDKTTMREKLHLWKLYDKQHPLDDDSSIGSSQTSKSENFPTSKGTTTNKDNNSNVLKALQSPKMKIKTVSPTRHSPTKLSISTSNVTKKLEKKLCSSQNADPKPNVAFSKNMLSKFSTSSVNWKSKEIKGHVVLEVGKQEWQAPLTKTPPKIISKPKEAPILTVPFNNMYSFDSIDNMDLDPDEDKENNENIPSLTTPPRYPLQPTSKAKVTTPQSNVAHLEEMILRQKEDLLKLHTELELSQMKQDEVTNRNSMAIQEIEAINFLNSIQEQKINELEIDASMDRMILHEKLITKKKKHRLELKRLQTEKVLYEDRANLMINQMRDQMTQLQSMAMTRIEQLEKELLIERRKCDTLETALAQATALKSPSGAESEEDWEHAGKHSTLKKPVATKSRISSLGSCFSEGESTIVMMSDMSDDSFELPVDIISGSGRSHGRRSSVTFDEDGGSNNSRDCKYESYEAEYEYQRNGNSTDIEESNVDFNHNIEIKEGNMKTV